jgi:hypothetical protein
MSASRIRVSPWSARAAIALALTLLGCGAETPTVCLGPPSAPAVPPQAVCEHLRMINCPIVECAAAYESWRGSVEPASFARVTNCYAAARTCEQVNACNRACGPAGGPVPLPPRDGAIPPDDASADGSAPGDAERQDATTPDDASRPVDAGGDASAADTVSVDATSTDVSSADAVSVDARSMDVSPADASPTDATSDAAGSSDAAGD